MLLTCSLETSAISAASGISPLLAFRDDGIRVNGIRSLFASDTARASVRLDAQEHSGSVGGASLVVLHYDVISVSTKAKRACVTQLTFFKVV